MLLALGASQYPVNKQFVIRVASKCTNEINKLLHHGREIGNIFLARKQLHILSSLSLIETNMKLASAYLPELDQLF